MGPQAEMELQSWQKIILIGSGRLRLTTFQLWTNYLVKQIRVKLVLSFKSLIFVFQGWPIGPIFTSDNTFYTTYRHLGWANYLIKIIIQKFFWIWLVFSTWIELIQVIRFGLTKNQFFDVKSIIDSSDKNIVKRHF